MRTHQSVHCIGLEFYDKLPDDAAVYYLAQNMPLPRDYYWIVNSTHLDSVRTVSIFRSTSTFHVAALLSRVSDSGTEDADVRWFDIGAAPHVSWSGP